MKKIALVTGGAGFIGSHMVDLLIQNNYLVRIIDNFSGGHLKNIIHHKNSNNLEIEEIDIRDLSKIHNSFFDVDEVYHFAGVGDIVPSIEKPQDYFDVNVMGTLKLLETIRNMKKIEKIVYAASSSCYGIADIPTNEKHKINPVYPYALSKYQGEMIMLHWKNVYNLPINIIRIFNAYGSRVKTTGAYGAVFGVFFKQILENYPLTVVGDGEQKRDFVHVMDVAEAFLKAGSCDFMGKIWNVGAGNPISINYLIKLLNYNLISYIPERPGEPKCTWANINKIKKDLNWNPKIKFEDGVKNMLKDIKDWKNAPLWTEKKISNETKNWFKFLSRS